MFQKVHDVLNLKFIQHQELLESFYPGINPKILIREFLTFNAGNKNENFLVDSFTENKINAFMALCLKGIPLEYITGIGHFYGRDFIVAKGVLIPRQETEIIIEEVNKIKNDLPEKITVLDLCAGSGCIGISLACELSTKVKKLILSDVSDDALNFIKINKQKFEYQYSQSTEIEIVKSDLFQNIHSMFDLIVTNPPYIKRHEQFSLVHEQVIKNEPHLALFIEDSEYDKFFDGLMSSARKSLKTKGYFFMEGHELELEKILQKWKINFSNDDVSIIQDLSGRDRFLKVRKE